MLRIFITLFYLCHLSLASGLSPITINSGFYQPESDLIDQILQEVSKRTKITIHHDVLPHKRALIHANKGLSDGDAARILDINTLYTNLIPIPVPSHSLDLMVVTNKKIHINKPSDLQKYHVGIINGMRIAILMVEKTQPRSLVKGNAQNIMDMLAMDHLDVVIINKMGLLADIEHIKEKSLYLKTTPLISRPLYMQLHKKNRAYIPIIQRALETMHEDGTWQKIQKDFYRPFESKIRNCFIPLEEASSLQ